MEVSQGFEGLQAEIEENFGEMIVALRRDIHREPELGFGTEWTAEKVLAAIDGSAPRRRDRRRRERDRRHAQGGRGRTNCGPAGRHGRPPHTGGDGSAFLLGDRGQDARLWPRRAHR